MSERTVPKPDFIGEAEWKTMMATRSPEIIRLGSRAHVQRYLETDGGEDTYITQGAPTLLIGTTGRKTGTEQISPATFLEDGKDVLIVGSVFGLDRHPSWVLNLIAALTVMLCRTVISGAGQVRLGAGLD